MDDKTDNLKLELCKEILAKELVSHSCLCRAMCCEGRKNSESCNASLGFNL